MSSIDEQLYQLRTFHISDNVVPCEVCNEQALWACFYEGNVHFLCEKHAQELGKKHKVKVFKAIHTSAVRES